MTPLTLLAFYTTIVGAQYMGFGGMGMMGYPYNMMMSPFGMPSYGGVGGSMYGASPYSMMGYGSMNAYGLGAGMGYGGYGGYGMYGMNAMNGMNGMNGMTGMNTMNGVNSNINNGNTMRNSRLAVMSRCNKTIVARLASRLATRQSLFTIRKVLCVIARDRASLIRQIELNNPEVSQHMAFDGTKHMKNLSVRYVSTVMPTHNALSEWTVLPLFQHGQDIPIDNDGKTAILFVHIPSLEYHLKAWRKRVASEKLLVRARKHHRKDERRQARQKRNETRKRKLATEYEVGGKVIKKEIESEHEDDPAAFSMTSDNSAFQTMDMIKEEPLSDVEYPSYGPDEGGFNTLDDDTTQIADAGYYDCGKPLDYELYSNSSSCERFLDHDDERPDGDSLIDEKRPIVKDEPYDPELEEQHPGSHTSDQKELKIQVSGSIDPKSCELSASAEEMNEVQQMEQQLASMENQSSQFVETSDDVSGEILQESEHAALNLEKEMIGEPMECKKFTESLLRLEPACVEPEPLSLSLVEERSSTTKAESKKHSVSNRIKHSLLQRMAEGRDVDVDTTSTAAALESDYKNTFCYLCRIDFSTSKGLYLHNVKSHSQGEVQCDVCYKPLKNRITLMKHKKLHLGADDMQCLCTDCGRPFKDKRALTAHVTYTKHMQAPPQSNP
ncbi:hypothetical protein Q1695_016076 [Nippostrongylus brasiliensis]|nr:hypothetical protein Q1695_016076 [Nippostrongylus brasiliensis]